MRTTISITDEQITTIDQIAKDRKISRAEVIKDALTNYLPNETKNTQEHWPAFGIWKDKKIDGLEYQRKLRS